MVTPQFVLAGRAVFTVANPKGEYYTYQVCHKAAEGQWKETWFAKLLTGPDNTSDYSYIGLVDSALGFRTTAKSLYQSDAKPCQVLVWALKRIKAGNLPEGYKIHHEGRCGRCGRVLTVPTSIETGLGPECAGKAGL